MKSLKSHYTHIRFLKSVEHPHQHPPDVGTEVAFVGRSNVGKSSVLNTLAPMHKIARTSKTPGRTQLINFFEVDNHKRLVDLPGYGYAKVPSTIQAHWEKLIGDYCQQRESLKGLILVMDIRHPLKPLDAQLLEWATIYQRRVHIILNKSDKFKRMQQQQTLQQTQIALKQYNHDISVQLFSALEKSGAEELKKTIDNWLDA